MVRIGKWCQPARRLGAFDWGGRQPQLEQVGCDRVGLLSGHNVTRWGGRRAGIGAGAGADAPRWRRPGGRPGGRPVHVIVGLGGDDALHQVRRSPLQEPPLDGVRTGLEDSDNLIVAGVDAFRGALGRVHGRRGARPPQGGAGGAGGAGGGRAAMVGRTSFRGRPH